jgi:hypothetical protein
MPLQRKLRLPNSALLAAALVAACGGGDKAAQEADAAAQEAAETEATPAADAATPAPAPSAPTSAPLEVSDIDRWEKGMAGEMEAVSAAAEKLKTANTSEDTLSAMMGVQEMSTMEAGAKASGVDLERYRVIRSNLSAAASYMTPELGGLDTAMLSPAQRAELKQMNEAQLKQLESSVPTEVLEALRPRAATLRKQELALVAERMKGAGIR